MKHLLPLLTVILSSVGFSANASAGRTLEVSAADLVEKVYGVADPSAGREVCRREAATRFSAIPQVEESAEWIGGDSGFAISYEGMNPGTDAMARYEGNRVIGYGYIFYFPYQAPLREAANNQQCRFCTAFLQDLTEMGIALGADPYSDELFDVAGLYKGNDVRMSLREDVDSESESAAMSAGEIPADRTGRFIVMLSISPAQSTALSASISE